MVKKFLFGHPCCGYKLRGPHAPSCRFASAQSATERLKRLKELKKDFARKELKFLEGLEIQSSTSHIPGRKNVKKRNPTPTRKTSTMAKRTRSPAQKANDKRLKEKFKKGGINALFGGKSAHKKTAKKGAAGKRPRSAAQLANDARLRARGGPRGKKGGAKGKRPRSAAQLANDARLRKGHGAKRAKAGGKRKRSAAQLRNDARMRKH
jgi:hypothetical protein